MPRLRVLFTIVGQMMPLPYAFSSSTVMVLDLQPELRISIVMECLAFASAAAVLLSCAVRLAMRAARASQATRGREQPML